MNAEIIAWWAGAGTAIIFAITFFLSYRANNYGFVDVAWSYSVGLGAVFYALCGAGWPPRRLAIGALMVLWSARLGTHLLRRVSRAHPHEDPRYHEMRDRWPTFFKTKMAAVFLFQALLVWLLDGPAWLAVQNDTSRFLPLEFTGLAVGLFAMVGEAIADRQLSAFKRAPSNAGQVCAVGLWRYSRHPNYFFEWLFWVGVALLVWPSPRGEYGLIAPIAMLVFLASITGIPPAERQSVRSKGDRYREYQRSTSAFFPWPPRAPSPQP